MSYILEALKKAERERHLGQAPKRSNLLHDGPKRNYAVWWILLPLILIASAGAYWFWLQNNDSAYYATTFDTATPITTNDATALDDTVTESSENSTQATTASVLVADSPINITPPVPFSQLSQALKAQLAPLNLDLHVYGDAPERRFVLINSRRYQVGDWLHEGPLLEAITTDGVVLSFKNQRFSLSTQP